MSIIKLALLTLGRVYIYIAVFLGVMLLSVEGVAQQVKPRVITRRYMEYEGERLMVAKVATVPIFKKGRRGQRALAKYQRLINAVKLTYPIAQDAKAKLVEMEAELVKIPTKKGQKEYVKGVEKELKREYTPVLKKMSMYQGVVLLKLIDRQTGDTSYELVKELRGSFSAVFWQGVARIFGANLKTEYNSKDDDALLEGIIQLYEEGLL